MPGIYDNIAQSLLPALQNTLIVCERADFCVGYFNLRGWQHVDKYVERWAGGAGNCCRLLVGMSHAGPHDELRALTTATPSEDRLSNAVAHARKRALAERFREQLSYGVPTDQDEAGLRRLARQIRDGKLVVKLFLRHPLHAKLYLVFRSDPVSPIAGFLGSSNLTLAGLSEQGELNVDVLDQDACGKLAAWFEDRWTDRWCVDISDELVSVIEESWAREEPIPPFHIYVKMAYHLSHEARLGVSEFHVPREFDRKLFPFQKAAVQIAAHHLNRPERGGVLIGDVVGLGKTLMATAVVRVFEEDHDWRTLILCPKNLVGMWEDYRKEYGMRAEVLSTSKVLQRLPELRRYHLVVIDESQNLRNREGKRYRAILEYIRLNDCRVVLLSATPYNKVFLDLSSQLRLFVPEDRDLSIRPEQYIKSQCDGSEATFKRKHQCSPHSIAAFEASEHPDDWRELMRLFMVRRTRSFIMANYAENDPEKGRKYLTFEDGTRSYFPVRLLKTMKFSVNDANPDDQYARMYAQGVVDTINALDLPRYGLGRYLAGSGGKTTPEEDETIARLSRAGKRLIGYCRTNLFKRLESSGAAFVQSVERHILRNYIYLDAIERDKPLPIGTQDAGLLDTRFTDVDDETTALFDDDPGADENEEETVVGGESLPYLEKDFRQRAADVYSFYSTHAQRRFRWLRPSLFDKETLRDALEADSAALMGILHRCGAWDAERDAKLEVLHDLITKTHPHEKIIVFTQFADTVGYLEHELKRRGVKRMSGVTGQSPDPTALAHRFSPVSNERRAAIRPENDLRVLIATDVLSEGQNLQDGFIVVNYDLPWAIIRLVQRAGRVDRIGQQAENILCYTFLPAEGVERIIRLRSRVRDRLRQNAEVVGTDEAFFEDDHDDQKVLDLYHEKAGLLDDDEDSETDLTSQAYQIWQNAIKADPPLEQAIKNMPDVVYSTKPVKPGADAPEGALVFVRTGEGNNALAWLDKDGNVVTESQFAVLKAAECSPDTPALPRHENHHELVGKAVELVGKAESVPGGQLGPPSSPRRRTYERLKKYEAEIKDTLFESRELEEAIQDIYTQPLQELARDTLVRQLKSGISDAALADLVVSLRADGRLCITDKERGTGAPQIICSLGLRADTGRR